MRLSLILTLQAAALVLILSGCSNVTPVQAYKIRAPLYNLAAIGYAGAKARGEVPPQVQPEADQVFTEGRERLLKLRAWIAENPIPANTPGAIPPELSAMKAAVDKARDFGRKYLAAYIGIPELVPLDVPATQTN